MRSWERAHPENRQGIEAMLNHLHIVDLHCNDATVTEAQARYLGRTLRSVWAAKLTADFPDLDFVVDFNDVPDLDPLDYELTFRQRDISTSRS